MVVMIENFASLDLKEYVDKLRDAIAHKKLIVMYVRCRVEYEGRSASKLEVGDRILIIKQDGAVLVHRPTGYSPVNWQPETTYIDVKLEGTKILLKAIRRSPREILNVEIEKVYGLTIGELHDTGTFYELLDESDIRDILAHYPELIEENSVTIDVEKRVEPGFIDLYLRGKNGEIIVVEIKRVKASISAVKQLKSYIDALSKHLPKERIKGVLVAPEATNSAIEACEKLGIRFKKIALDKIVELKRKLMEEKRERTLLDYLKS